MPIVSARGLVKTCGSGAAARRVLDDADLDVERGELVAVVGRSGSGARRLAYLDVQGGRPNGDAGAARDRNALLFLPR